MDHTVCRSWFLIPGDIFFDGFICVMGCCHYPQWFCYWFMGFHCSPNGDYKEYRGGNAPQNQDYVKQKKYDTKPCHCHSLPHPFHFLSFPAEWAVSAPGLIHAQFNIFTGVRFWYFELYWFRFFPAAVAGGDFRNHWKSPLNVSCWALAKHLVSCIKANNMVLLIRSPTGTTMCSELQEASSPSAPQDDK